MGKWIDRDYYSKHVADPDTGERRTFTGGDLAAIDTTLDALWNGVPYEVERRELDAAVRAVCALLGQMLGQDTPPVSKPSTVVRIRERNHQTAPLVSVGLDSTAWLDAVQIVLSEDWPSNIDPARGVNFKLDLLRAMRMISRNYRRAIIHAMDGYDYAEIASLMGWEDDEGQPNEETAERTIRRASADIRRSCSPGYSDDPIPPKHKMNVTSEVEQEIEDTRQWRKREERRRKSGKAKTKVRIPKHQEHENEASEGERTEAEREADQPVAAFYEDAGSDSAPRESIPLPEPPQEASQRKFSLNEVLRFHEAWSNWLGTQQGTGDES